MLQLGRGFNPSGPDMARWPRLDDDLTLPGPVELRAERLAVEGRGQLPVDISQVVRSALRGEAILAQRVARFRRGLERDGLRLLTGDVRRRATAALRDRAERADVVRNQRAVRTPALRPRQPGDDRASRPGKRRTPRGHRRLPRRADRVPGAGRSTSSRNPDYDRLAGCPDWARATLAKHASDHRYRPRPGAGAREFCLVG
jgi:hypothetical protein